MRITVHLPGTPASETVSPISSFLLHDPFGVPVLVGLEYIMPEGTAWTLASADEDDFHKILGTSGILHTLIPGSRPGTPNLHCTPILRKGVPRWFTDVDELVVGTDMGLPFFLVRKIGADRFQGVLYQDQDFRDLFNKLWNRQQ
jgi:hypothetical protein